MTSKSKKLVDTLFTPRHSPSCVISKDKNEFYGYLFVRLNQMRGRAIKIAGRYSQDSKVRGVLLFGSVVTGYIHPASDLDIVVVEDSNAPIIERLQYTEQGIDVDLWRHSFDFYRDLFNRTWQSDEMFQKSMFLNIIQNCEILHDSDSTFKHLKQKSQYWEWPKNCINHLLEKQRYAKELYQGQSLDKFESTLFTRKMVLLDTCIDLMKNGKPVSNRVKDLYKKNARYFKDERFDSAFQQHPDHKTLRALNQETLNMFREEIPNRSPFTELTDAEKHYEKNEDFMATMSLQNGAFYVGRSGLRNRNIELNTRGFIFPETEIELIRKTKDHWPAFYKLYRRVHNIDA